LDGSRQNGLDPTAETAVDGVARLAADVVARLVAKDKEVGSENRRGFLERFVRAVTNPGPFSYQDLVPEMRRARITPEMLADIYIPAVARQLGDDWHHDRLSFAVVSIASARLQSLLREVGESWSADSGRRGRKGAVLVVIPAREQHTLGAMILVGQLRRRGISVCLSIAPGAAELRDLVRRDRFDGVLLSVGSDENLDVCRSLVDIIRQGTPTPIPVVVGGAILGTQHDVAARIGADHATQDMSTAMAMLGMSGDAGLALPGV